MKILGIETSCDETAAAIVRGTETRQGASVKVLSNIISSQIDIHKKYGGVVPEVAAREHVLNILPVVNEALEKANLTPLSPLLARRGGKIKQPKKNSAGIDAIAVSTGPGLITSLMVGVETAKTLSYAWDAPVIGINHIEGHINANFVGKFSISNFQFPILILTVSGGHTMLVLMEKMGEYKTIGETRDDAAGEAFDKAAKLMDIGYPGGPAVSAEAEKLRVTPVKRVQANYGSRVQLPRPMINSDNFDFSFSGLKTALFYELKKDKDWENKIPEYCHEFQQAIIDVLISKTIKAAKKYNAKTVMLTGGVSANKELREQMEKKINQELPTSTFKMPDLKYTTDNAAMIATAGYFKAKDKKFTPWQELKVDCNLKL